MRSYTRGWLLSFVLALGCVSVSHGQIVKDVVARQRYPWNNLVDIDYTLENMPQDTAFDLEVSVEDQISGKKYFPTSFNKTPCVQDGRHRITWDPQKDDVAFESSKVIYKISIAPRYLVIDLSSGASSTSYPVSYLPSPPVGGWSDEYKTTKLVLRRIPAGRFTMGSPAGELGAFEGTSDEPWSECQHEVTLT